MTLLGNARLVLPTGVVERGHVRVDGERITEVAEVTGVAAHGGGPEARGVVDLAGRWLLPGFVDIHVHGGAGASFMSGTAESALAALRLHGSHGTTTSLASLVTADLSDLERAAAQLSELVEDGVLAGIHLEGPFISPRRCGAHDPALVRLPDLGALRRLLGAGRGAVRMVTLAPELPGGIEMTSRLADEGVVAAIGHTDAGHEEALAAMDAGASVATHLFNAMAPVHHRRPGAAVAALARRGVVVELINDGTHLHDAVLELAFATAGAHRVALVTDAMAAAGMGDGVYRLGPTEVRVDGGVARVGEPGSLAGSTLCQDQILRRCVQVNSIPIEEASLALSLTPARVLGLEGGTGSLEAGKLADLVVLDEDLTVVAVMRRGEWVKGSGGLDAGPVVGG